MKSCLTSYLRFAWRLDSLLCIKRNNLTKPKSSLTATIKRKINAFEKSTLNLKKRTQICLNLSALVLYSAVLRRIFSSW